MLIQLMSFVLFLWVSYCQFVFFSVNIYMSRPVRKPTTCICENKGADQLCSNCEAYQRLCFRYTDSTIPLLSKSKISSLWPSSLTVHAGLCQTCSETTLLAQLSRRLMGSLQYGSRAGVRPCVRACVRVCVRSHFQRSSSLKPLGRSKPNLMWSIHG